MLYHDRTPKLVSFLISVPALPSLNWEEQEQGSTYRLQRGPVAFNDCRKGKKLYISYGSVQQTRLVKLSMERGKC